MTPRPSYDVMKSFEPFVAELDAVIRPFCQRSCFSVRLDRGIHPGRELNKRGGEVDGGIDISLVEYPEGGWAPTFSADVPFQFQCGAGVQIGRDIWFWEPAGGRDLRTDSFGTLRKQLADLLDEAAAFIASIQREEVLADGWHANQDAQLSWSDVEAFNVWLDDRRAMPKMIRRRPRGAAGPVT